MAHISLEYSCDMHQALSDPLRVLIVRLLLERELCVCEIVRVLEQPQYKISRHLAVLKNAGLVADRREGTWMHYEIAAALPARWKRVLKVLCGMWDETPEVQAALWRLQHRATREPGRPAFCNV